MHKAFHLAESYQLPVLVLSDAYIAQRRQIRDPRRRRRRRRAAAPALDARRRARRASTSTGEHGVGAFRVPGHAGRHLPGGRHRAHARRAARPPTRAMHHQMNAKRFRKLDADRRARRTDWFRTLGRDRRAARHRGVGQPVRPAARVGRARIPSTACSCPRSSHPFPLEAFEEWRAGSSRPPCSS